MVETELYAMEAGLVAEHPHDPESCPNHFRVMNLEKWQKDQNGSLVRMATALEKMGEKVDSLQSAEDKRTGAEGMLKWILGFVGFGTLASVLGLLLQLSGVVG